MQDFQEYPKAIYKDGDVLKEAIVVFDAGQEALNLELGFEPAKDQVSVLMLDGVQSAFKKRSPRLSNANNRTKHDQARHALVWQLRRW